MHRVSCVHLLSAFFCVVLLIVVVKSQNSCTTLKNITARVHVKNGQDFNKTLDGCIERIAFEVDKNSTISEAYIQNQNIPKLGIDTVRNMAWLGTISFSGCQIESVEPGAFRNVPRLRKVQISYGYLKEIRIGVFNVMPRLEELRIHDNQIDIIEDQSFSNLPALIKVYGSNNKLQYWNREWFSNTTELLIMDFSFNKIRTLPREAFASLNKLRKIIFDYNEITAIQPEAFKGIKSLDYLGLRYNRLKELQENIFPNELKIKSFFVDANYLNFIPDELLKKVSLKEISIYNNPWKCQCLNRIHDWLFVINGTAKKGYPCSRAHVPVCAYPTVVSKTCLEDVDQELTDRFITTLKSLEKPLDKYCARLD